MSSSAIALTLNGTNLTMGSLNQVNNLSRTISNNDPGTTNSTLTLGGGDGNNAIGGDVADLIYLGCSSCSLTFQRANGGDGIGVLNLSTVQSGRFDVAQGNATLNISSNVSIGFSTFLTKTGAGTLNFSGQLSAFNAGLAVSGGTVNFLPATVTNGLFLNVSNPNTGAGSAVTLNLHNSASFRGISGAVATPSTGENSAAVVLHGTATQLTLTFGASQPRAIYGGIITGNRSVSTNRPQTFTGSNTYTGATTVLGGTLIIDGSTSGQGNYSIGGGFTPGATLSGSGAIGLGIDRQVTLTGSTLDPGPTSDGVGTLHVSASGSGGVVFGSSSMFRVQVADAGARDRLVIPEDPFTCRVTSTGCRSAAWQARLTAATTRSPPSRRMSAAERSTPCKVCRLDMQCNTTQPTLVWWPSSCLCNSRLPSRGRCTALLVPSTLTCSSNEPVECRASGGDHTLIFTFTNYLVSGSARVSSGQATIVGSPTLSGRTMTVNLTGVADVQKIGVTSHNVTDRFSHVLPETTVMVNMLLGDTTGNRSVNASDVGQTKAASGFVTTASNFRQA